MLVPLQTARTLMAMAADTRRPLSRTITCPLMAHSECGAASYANARVNARTPALFRRHRGSGLTA